MLSYAATFLKSQLLTSIPVPTSDFSGQMIIVTGSNTGLGLEAARHFVRLRAAKVILAVRTLSKGETAAADIVRATGAPKATVEVWHLDMSDYASIKAFAKRAQGLQRLDAAVLNAGILTQVYKAQNGMESQIAVNTVGAMLLSTLLLPKMRQSAKETGLRGRLSIVGSDLMYVVDMSEIDTDDSILERINNPDHAQMGQRYQLSKQLVFYSLQELARRNPISPTSNVIVNIVTPGACKSDIFRDDAGAVAKFFSGVAIGVIARTTEAGSRTYVHAVDPDLPPQAHGRFLMDCKIASSGTNVDSVRGQERARKWNAELFSLLEEIDPGCTALC